MSDGKFITFEGGEGTGKSTQLRLLEKYLENVGISVVTTREPGGTPSGEDIRHLLVNGETNKWKPLTEVLLHYAARHEHITRIIQPTISSGKWVLCDRYTDSTLAYQGFAQHVDFKHITELQKIVVGRFTPNLTIILDLPVEIGLKRAEERDTGGTRYERMGLKFHQTLRESFLKIADDNPERCVVFNANKPEILIEKEIINLVNKRFNLSNPMELGP